MSNIIIFEADAQQVEVRLDGETLWVTQSQMGELLGTSADNISLHLKNIYQDNELDEQASTEDFSVVRQEGARQVKRQLKHYNLDAIISVGYRVNSGHPFPPVGHPRTVEKTFHLDGTIITLGHHD